MAPSHLSLVLHAHLPPRGPGSSDPVLGWLLEILEQSYLPLIAVLRGLDRDGVPGKLTWSLSVPLIEMLQDPALGSTFLRFMDARVAALERLPEEAALDEARRAHLHHYQVVRQTWDAIDADVLGELRRLDSAGRIELGICAGMHAILPLVASPQMRARHVVRATEAFEKQFGRPVRFMWLPECGFAPGVERHLADAGVWCTAVEAQSVAEASCTPVFGNFAPLVCGDVAFFGRDEVSGHRVWSRESGFPGDPAYREFHVQPVPGYKPRRVTDRTLGLDEKQAWEPQRAEAAAARHAVEFVDELESRLAQATSRLERPAHLTAAFDAELFGHWWFEGPEFLRGVFERAAQIDTVELSTPVDYLRAVRVHQEATPAPGTWGQDASFAWWIDESTAWIYPLIASAERRLLETEAARPGDPRLDQAARELMCAQASDWPFAIRKVGFAQYAEQRVRDHLARFDQVLAAIESSTEPE